MGKYFRSSYYYPDDKDIYDFLSATHATIDAMLQFLRREGIYVSEKESREHLCEYISLYYLSWENAEQLVDLVNVRETDEPATSQSYSWTGPFSDVSDAMKGVQAIRATREREVYTIDATADAISVTVSYVEIENGKTRLLQQREKSLSLQIQKRADGFHVRYDNNPRSEAIIQTLIGQLQEQDQSEEKKEIRGSGIDLSGVTSAKGRVDFFRKMMDGIEGLDLREVTKIGMERLPGTVIEGDEELDEDDVEETIEKMIVYGRRLWQTPAFQEFVEKGFFVSNATWRSELKQPTREHVELSAGFSSPKEGQGFQYKVHAIFRRDDNGDLRPARERVLGAMHETLLLGIEAGAETALAEVLAEQEAQKPGS